VASQVDIANRALQKIGAARIDSFDEGTREANAVKACYESVRDSELQRNLWTFSIRRASLAADTATPAFGRSYQYSLPADYLRKAPYDRFSAPMPDDALFEGRKVLTDYAAPLEIVYVSNAESEETYDPLFVEALAARLAVEICEELTQSTSKRADLSNDYLFHISQAKSANSIQAGPKTPEVDEWVYVRQLEGSPNHPYRTLW